MHSIILTNYCVAAHSAPHIYSPQKPNFSVLVTNATEEQLCTVELRFTSIKSGAETQMAQHEKTKVKATSTTKVTVHERPEYEPTVLSA